MNPEESEQLRERLRLAEVAGRRKSNLKSAIDKIVAGTVSRLNIAIQEDSKAVQYQGPAAGLNYWETVCWAETEEGIVEEIKEAVVAILEKRLAEAEVQYNQA